MAMTYWVGRMKYSVRLSEHPEYGLRIADIISLWSTTEHLLSQVFAVVAGTDSIKSSLLIGSIEASRGRMGLIRAAGEMTLKNHSLLRRFTALMNNAEKCLDNRNKYAHAVYALNEKNQLCRVHIAYDWRESPKAVTVISLSDLDAALQRLKATYDESISLLQALWQELPAEYIEALQVLNLQRGRLGQSSTAGGSPRSDKGSSPPPPKTQGE